jgi:hypothetical protein
MRTRRPGQASLYALLALPVMLGVLVLVLVFVRQRDTATELRNAAVASALAAAGELADDALLTDDPDRIRPVLERARAVADGVGQRNLVEGKRLAIHPPKGDQPGDLLFGHFDPADGVEGQFRPVPNAPTGNELGRLDAVRLTARHPFRGECAFTRVTAVFDRHVCGFRPLPDRPAPLVPIALYDGAHTADRPAWGKAVPAGKDGWARTAGNPVWAPGRDGLPEVTVRVGWQKETGDGAVCGFPVRFGDADRRGVLRQIATGVSAADLHAHGGEISLCDGKRKPAHGDPGWCLPHDDDEDEKGKGKGKDEDEDEDGDLPLGRFRQLARTGEARVWPVFSAFTEGGEAVLVGFTAARVVSAEREKGTGAVLLTLQPAVVATPTAVTRPDRPPYDRTVGRVRVGG